MATFTITVPTNMDALTSKGGSDTYNVNGGELTIDNDTRYGQNQSTSARFGTIAASATLGGTVKFRSNKIRVLYFTGGSGNVPAYNTTISQGSASGLLIGVHSALNAAPTTPGSAMPASGYIRIKQWNDVAFSSGALTGITATCAADPTFGTYDRVGWMIVVGEDAKSFTINRLNNTSDDPFVGAKLLVGITDGTRTTGYQIPNNGEALYFAGVEVETSAGSGVYEWWPTTTSPMTSYHIRTTGEASKQCYLDSANAIIYFGYDGTNSSGGQCPGAGRNVRIPNMFLQGCTAAAPTVNSFSAIGSRYFCYPNGAGRWRMTDVSMAWRANIVTNAYEVYVKDSSICQTLTISSNATPFELDSVCISNPTTDAVNNNGLVISSTSIGGTATDSVFSVGYSNNVNKAALSITSSANVTFDTCKFMHAGMPNSSANAVNTSIADFMDFQNCTFVGKHTYSQSTNITAQNCTSDGVTSGDPLETSYSVPYFALSNRCSDFLFEDWTFAQSEQLGKAALITLSGTSTNNKFRSMGTYASPIMARGAINYDASWSRSGSTITVTLTGHGFRTNDFIKVMYRSSSAVSSTGLKIITVTGANTFTYTGAASGDLSGTLTFFRTWASVVADVGSGCEDNEFQDIWVDGSYSQSASTVVTSYNTTLLNIGGGGGAVANYSGIDVTARGVSTSAVSPAATSAQYGHTFADGILSASTGLGATGVSWSRSGTTITVTSPNHGFDLNNSFIRLYDPSDGAALSATTGYKAVTILTKDTFTFTGAASGATSGTLSWDAPTDMLTLFMNEQSDAVTRYTIDSGTPAFTGAGALSAITVGDQITWTMPEYLINYTGFENMPIKTSMTETEASQGVYRFMYDIAKDDGAFSGTFKNLALTLAATGGTSGTAIMTFADTSLIAANDKIYGYGVPAGAYVVSVDSSTQITISTNLTLNYSGSYIFNHLPAETFTTNFKLKVRQVTLTANSTSNSYINIPLTSDATSRAETYPIVAVTVNITVTGIASGYRIQVYNVTQATEIDNTTTTGTSYTYVVTNEAADGDIIRVRLAKADKLEIQQSTVFSSTAGATILAEPEDDDVYDAYGIDGSTLTSIYDWDAGNQEVEIDETTSTWSQKEFYAWYKYYITTSTGIDELFGLVEAKDAGNIEIGDILLDNQDSVDLAPTDEVRVYRTDEAWIGKNPSTGGGGIGVYSTGTIYVKNINTATNVITGDIADVPTVSEIVDGVLDEALSGHTTPGTVGEAIDNSGGSGTESNYLNTGTGDLLIPL